MALAKDVLLSTSHKDLADALIIELQDAVIAKYHVKEKPAVAHFLGEISRQVSKFNAAELTSKLQGVPEKYRPMLADTFVRMGQLYEMAGLVARDNVFLRERDNGKPISNKAGDNLVFKHHTAKGLNRNDSSDASSNGDGWIFKTTREKPKYVKGGAAEFIAKLPEATTAAQSVDALNAPVFAMTFTAHPTNVISLDAIKAQRDLARAIDAVRMGEAGGDEKLQKAFSGYINTDLLTKDADGNHRNLNTQEETEHMLHYVRTLYYDLPHIYARFDAPLREKFRNSYDPLTLMLNTPLASWGSSGDKDGNANVNGDSTLRAMASHSFAILQMYEESLAKIDAPELKSIKGKIQMKYAAVKTARGAIEMAVSVHKNLSPEQFDALSAQLAKAVSGGIQKEEFESELVNAYNAMDANTEGNARAATLDMIRRVHMFGMEGAKLEYRETAEEYTRIVGELIDGYSKMDEATRSSAITAILQNPDKLTELQSKLKAFACNGVGKAYSKDDVAPIAYHTLKRMELARDFPNMVHDHVLAECQGTSNFMETLLLQKLAKKDGKEPKLGIIPLFEEYGTLGRADEIVKDALSNPEYKQHMESLVTLRGQEKPTQQVQLAHSDNARRAGMPAARAYIYEAHNKLRNMAKTEGVAMQFYEGGSQSDPYRGGVRAQSASINEFGIHDFAKFTYQGGDLVNFLNYPSSAIRLMTRNITHCAKGLLRQKGGHAAAEIQKTIGGAEKTNPELDAQAMAALKKTVSDYENSVFNNPAFNEFMRVIDYNAEKDAGNAGSRAGGRSTSTEVDVKSARTISFSEGLQHAGITPTWIGAKNLYSYLKEASGKKTLNPQDLHAYYKESPVFKDVVDRMLFGLAKTDIDGLRTRLPELKTSMFLDDLAQEYRYCVRLALGAATGKTISEQDVAIGGGSSLSDLRTIVMKEALPDIAPVMEHKNGYMDVSSQLKTLWSSSKGGQDDTYMRRLLHAAGDIVHHGRFLGAEDPRYAEMVRGTANQNVEINRVGRAA